MEKRGSGLRKMRELTEKLPNFLKEKEPSYKTTTSTFYTTFYNLNWDKNGRIPIDEVAARVNSSEKNLGVNEESTLKKFGETEKSSEKNKKKNIGRTSQRVIDLVISDPSISAETMASKIGISSRAVEKHIYKLRSLGILIREGADRGGYWRIIVKPK